MVTDQSGRLIAYTCEQLSAYSWEGVNGLPYGITQAIAAAQNAAASRGEKVGSAQTSIERIELVQYSALETAIANMSKATDGLLAQLG